MGHENLLGVVKYFKDSATNLFSILSQSNETFRVCQDLQKASCESWFHKEDRTGAETHLSDSLLVIHGSYFGTEGMMANEATDISKKLNAMFNTDAFSCFFMDEMTYGRVYITEDNAKELGLGSIPNRNLDKTYKNEIK